MKPKQRADAADLRRQAGERVASQATNGDVPPNAHEVQRLVHELQVHQLELEMQNEELRSSRAQLEAAAARYTDLYDFAPVGYFTLARTGVITQLNLAGARLLGVERARGVGRHMASFLSGADLSVFNALFDSAFTSRSPQTCEVDFQSPGQRSRSVRIDAELTADGQECRAVAVDITERKQIETRYLQAQKMEAIGLLAGGVAHDFNNILAAILMQLGLLELDTDLTPTTRQGLKELKGGAKRAATLTRQLLQFSRKSVINVKVLDLNAMIEDVISLLRRVIGEQIDFRLTLGSALPPVEADAGMLEQVMMNLAVNARDAMPLGGRLTISTSLADFNDDDAKSNPLVRSGKSVCLTVTDTGCGMDPETLKHVFEPFFTTKEVGKGTGLGLATVHGIVGQHQGWVDVQSEVGKGTAFRVFLPAVTGTVPTQGAQEDMPLLSLKGHETILLVEDAVTVRRNVGRVLRLLGYRVFEAANGIEAMVLWEKERDKIDLLFTDMTMPEGISGHNLANKLLAEKPGLKVIISSGYTTEVDQQTHGSTSRITYLPKPYDACKLGSVLRSCLNG